MAILAYNTFTEADYVELKKPSYREPHTMDPRTWLRDLTPYFLYTLFISTIGPLLFGYHLVRIVFLLDDMNILIPFVRLNSILQRKLLHASESLSLVLILS